MNYANIKTYSIENGTGVRVSLFVSGCTHHCKGCFNEEAWDFSYETIYKETEDEIIHDLEPDYMAGILAARWRADGTCEPESAGKSVKAHPQRTAG